jgi:hypothetical protein
MRKGGEKAISELTFKVEPVVKMRDLFIRVATLRRGQEKILRAVSRYHDTILLHCAVHYDDYSIFELNEL